MFIEECLQFVRIEDHYLHIQGVMGVISMWLLEKGYKYFKAESAVVELLRCRTAYLSSIEHDKRRTFLESFSQIYDW